ncbi:MAG: hypothetical protein ACREKL_06775, partial [Chthoniobacterales bacterium]
MKLVAINTIGLTGAEILAAELARFPELLMLPGQNFINFETHCYRPHDYNGWSVERIFDNLHKHQFTRSGHCWAGLTKSMSPGMLGTYDRARHLAEFSALSKDDAETFDHFRNYAVAFARTMGQSLDARKYFGFFGNNIVVNAAHYPGFLEKSAVIDFTNPLDFWLANIGQRMVWENTVAIRFWLVNMLFVRRWELKNPGHYTAVDIREYTRDRDVVSARLKAFLNLESKPAADVPDGFIRFSPEFVARFERNAADLRRIYEGWTEFDLGMNFSAWADAFLAEPEIDELLARYGDFWNSTTHTNLDWIGPIEEEIVGRLLEFTGAKSRRNISRWFYHECFHLSCDDWQNPTGTLEHYLGCLEEEIVLPEMPFYVRIALCYFEKVADNTIKRAY